MESPSSIAADPQPPVSAETRDVVLMLDNGPLHVRLRVSVGKQSPTEARKGMIEQLLKSLDTNGDGKFAREEAQRSPLFREKQRGGVEKFIKEIGADMTLTPKNIAQRIEQFGGETVVYRQNTSTSDTDGEVFKLIDADGNGVISEVEMSDAVDGLLSRDSDDDECVTLDEFAPPPDPMAMAAVTQMERPRGSVKSVADILRDTNQTLLGAEMIRKYDANRDKQLDADELHWPKERIAPCDTDRDGKLSVRELVGLSKTMPDIELAVDVVRTTGEPMLRVISTSGARTDGDRFPDLMTINLPSAVVTFSTREVDPFEASMAIALRTFNELDTDANGYLEKDETTMRERFGRGLFDQIDADGDGKIFGEEMKDFIRSRGEPVATTCHITAFDDGAGFFSALDVNGDRRISMREMRYAGTTLKTMQRDDKPGLASNEPARRYRIEFVRGVFNPFGNPDRPAAIRGMTQTEVATIKPRPVGPVWFQRWDRNNDGDLTWREFFGPRDAFEQLDADRDELIDPKEAEAAAALAGKSQEPATKSQGNIHDETRNAEVRPQPKRSE